MADARAVLVRHGEHRRSSRRSRSDFRAAADVLPVRAARLSARRRLADDARRCRLHYGRRLHRDYGRHARDRGRRRHAPRRGERCAMARAVDLVRHLPVRAGGARVSRKVRPAVRRPHDLRGRHLHRRAHHAHRPAGRLDRARRRRPCGARERVRRSSGAVADRLRRARRRLLCPCRRARLRTSTTSS